MNIAYYPGCTLKTKAKNLEASALASLEALDLEVVELDRWNCCGAVYSLTSDDLIHHVGPARNLVRAKEQGAQRLVTLCSMCYNTLARVNRLMREDEEKRATINRFMDEEIDYNGEVEVVHFLTLLEQEIGWQALGQKVKVPLTGLRVGTYYGCTLQRPAEVGIEAYGSFTLMTKLFEALGAAVVPFAAADKCCGSYQVLNGAAGENNAAATVLATAHQAGIDALVTSCPLCEYNLGKHQDALIDSGRISAPVSTYYFSQLLALALGCDAAACHLELNAARSRALLEEKKVLSAA